MELRKVVKSEGLIKRIEAVCQNLDITPTQYMMQCVTNDLTMRDNMKQDGSEITTAKAMISILNDFLSKKRTENGRV